MIKKTLIIVMLIGIVAGVGFAVQFSAPSTVALEDQSSVSLINHTWIACENKEYGYRVHIPEGWVLYSGYGMGIAAVPRTKYKADGCQTTKLMATPRTVDIQDEYYETMPSTYVLFDTHYFSKGGRHESTVWYRAGNEDTSDYLNISHPNLRLSLHAKNVNMPNVLLFGLYYAKL